MRKINNALLQRMISGDLSPLLNYIKRDDELRLEVRREGEAFIYYRKGKALEIGKLKVDLKYGQVPDTSLAVDNPPQYFEEIKDAIDNWLDNKKDRAEFDTQQKIARDNQGKDDRYIILDMEYAFEQHKIKKENREKRAVFDLLGIERKTNKIIFFEVKKGMGATKGKSGIEEHINDFSKYIHGKNTKVFRNNLIRDIKNILDDKRRLGIIQNFSIPNNLGEFDPELIFVFHPADKSEVLYFSKELEKRHKLIIVGNDNYKLRY
ncbi:MAG: hypothetical protein HN392_07660 [Anaerolineae bacterium]|jgi:hypothetical protein|nr:hypothetical protein [Anaerolineae bacterium]MBT7073593.1 hypothetical protein [Anaerolineae bacterium]